MRNMKKIFVLFLALICLSVAACTVNTSMSYTYNVETGDAITVKLNTADGYSITSELPFTVTKGGETVGQGYFITEETYQTYVSSLSGMEGAKVIGTGERADIEYIFWCYNDTEYNYAVLVKGSKTGAVVGNNISQASAEECMGRLTFSKE